MAPRDGPMMERVARHGPYAVDRVLGPGPDVVIVFSSIGHDPTRPPGPEFVRTATAGGRSALFVTDAARSFGHAPGLVQVLADAMARLSAPRGRVLGMGLSMGAVAALWAACDVPMDAVLAIGPQSRLDDPSDSRWRDWVAAIPGPVLPTPLPDVPVTMLHGLADDRAQAMGFVMRPGVDHLLFPGITHSDLAPHLRARGCLAGLVDAVLMGDRRRLIRIATGAGALRRRA